MTTAEITLASAALLMVAGAAASVLLRDMMRVVVGLGVFFLGIAAVFLALGFPFLAIAEVFLYVGGVLVLVLFSVMMLGRESSGRPVMAGRQDIGAALSAFAVFAMMFLALSPAAGDLAPAPAETTVAALATELLGPQIVAFELAGGLLLLAFVAVIALAQGGSKR